jgi:hypothetical protein
MSISLPNRPHKCIIPHMRAKRKNILRVGAQVYYNLCRVPPSALCKGTNKGSRWRSLCRVSPNTLDKGILFVECHLVHSVKTPFPLSAAMTMTFHSRVPCDTQQSVCQVPDKKYSANKPLSMYSSLSSLCQVSHSTKPSPRVFRSLPSASYTR